VRPLGGGGPGDPDSGKFWISEATSVDADPPFTFTMGSGARFPQRTFQGALDDIRIYDHELTRTEVHAMSGTPEPSSCLLIVIGLGVMLGARRR